MVDSGTGRTDWARQLRTRFPLLQTLRAGPADPPASHPLLPAFLGILLAAMDSRSQTPVCFVLPKRGDVARIASVVLGLHRFRAAQGDLTKGYGESHFKSGDLVRIHPGKHVFRYGGFDPRSPEFICLRPVNGTERDRWSVRAATFVPRLERTTLTRPMGRMNTPIHDPEPAPLDRLLGTSTFGNQGLFRNELLLLDSSTGFQRFVETTVLQERDTGAFVIKSLVPFGDVAPPLSSGGSWLRKWDERNPSGEPLVATTASAEALANLCIDAPAFSKLVVVNGLARVKDLQSFDDMRQTQHLVLFAEYGDEELIETLADRGCRFWELTADEIDIGAEESRPTNDDVLGRLRLWARNKENLTFDAEPCESKELDDVAIRLDGLRNLINRDEEGPAVRLVARLWRILNETAAIVSALTQEQSQRAVAQLKQFEYDLQANKAWLTPEAEAALMQSASELESLLHRNPDPGTTKRAAVERVVAECLGAGMTSVVIVRGENHAVDLDKGFGRYISSGKLRVCTPRGLKADSAYDRIICLSWPGGTAMEELAVSLAAPRITLIGYAFERRWLNQCAYRLKRRPRSHRIGEAEKSALVSGTELAASMLVEPLTPPPARDEDVPRTETDIWAFEQRLRAARKGSAGLGTQASDPLPARYVGFVGPTYAFLTDTHRMVVATDLLTADVRSKQRLPERTVAELKHGDFITFPESGDRELIHEKADQLLGTDAPRLRRTARLWKEALWAGGLKPAEFLRHAKELGRPRHILTIRNWFADSPQMGPGTGNDDLTEDLELIALVTNHEPLRNEMDAVISAVKTLRGAHLSAGVRLRDVLIQRLPEVIGRVEEEGSVVDLGDLGSAWIVQIESIAPGSEPRGRMEVNRLLWADQRADAGIAF